MVDSSTWILLIKLIFFGKTRSQTSSCFNFSWYFSYLDLFWAILNFWILYLEASLIFPFIKLFFYLKIEKRQSKIFLIKNLFMQTKVVCGDDLRALCLYSVLTKILLNLSVDFENFRNFWRGPNLSTIFLSLLKIQQIWIWNLAKNHRQNIVKWTTI